MDAASSCGLIVNELVSNAYKHAFPNGRTGTVRVRLEVVRDAAEAPMVQLSVNDNGAGPPPAYPAVQGMQTGTQACPPNTSSCVYTSLSYFFTFRVLAPNGNFAPQFPDYAFTYVAFRDGPTSTGRPMFSNRTQPIP